MELPHPDNLYLIRGIGMTPFLLFVRPRIVEAAYVIEIQVVGNPTEKEQARVDGKTVKGTKQKALGVHVYRGGNEIEYYTRFNEQS